MLSISMKKFNFFLASNLILLITALIFISAKSLNFTKKEPLNALSEYEIDLRNSKILWNIKTSRGGNNGELLIKSGTMLEDKNMVKSSEILIDMTAIQIRSIPPGIVNMKAVTILNTESFFDVAKHPTAKLEITKTVAKSSSSFEVIGFLTIKGRKNPIRFLMEGGFFQDHFEGRSKNIVVNRNLYDIRYESENNTDKEFDLKVEDAIDNSFSIDVFIVANKIIKNQN